MLERQLSMHLTRSLLALVAVLMIAMVPVSFACAAVRLGIRVTGAGSGGRSVNIAVLIILRTFVERALGLNATL